jgi:hypothetical protein
MNTGGGFGKKLFEEGSKIGQSSSLNQSKNETNLNQRINQNYHRIISRYAD